MNRVPLSYWIQQVLGQSQAQVKLRLRGNNLHILCESNPCPEADSITLRFKQAIANTSLDALLSPDSPQVHRLILYGRTWGESEPNWRQVINLGEAAPGDGDRAPNSPQSHREATPTDEPSLAAKPTPGIHNDESFNRELAQQGVPEAIARYLSQAFSPLGIAVRAKVDSPLPDTSCFANRLLIACESAYVPDAALLAEPIAQRLRELELTQFRDAVVFGQVRGETRPEWLVRVDLTPPDEILKEWARWGDVQAITRLLNRFLASHQIQLAALLKDCTLHLSCAQVGDIVPDKLTAIAAIAPLLQTLSPQGIHAATIYGVSAITSTSTLPDVTPAWVYWLDLPSANQPELALSTLDRARQGDLSALTFLLVRLLNPDLDVKLATGGIRVQLRQKGDLLHVMTEAPNCPRQEVVAPAISRFLKPLNIATLTGVRIYGRRSGQKQPLWHYGQDFVTRHRLEIQEITPEFAASAAHVDELLAPPGEIVPWAEVTETSWHSSLQNLYKQVVGQVQRSLIRTQLVIPTETLSLADSPLSSPATATTSAQQNWKIAALWSTVGLLLVLQTDWVLGTWVRLQAQNTAIAPPPSAPAPVASPSASQLPPDLLNKSRVKNWADFDTSTFTQPGKTVLEADTQRSGSPPSTNPESGNQALPASPFLAKAETVLGEALDFPTFNSRQLDSQIALYRRYLEINGAPDVLIVGSSRALRGVDPAALEAALAEQGYEGVQVFNMGVNGATAQVVDLLVQQVLPQDQLPKLILFADGGRAFNSGRQDITYNGIVASQGYQALLAGNLPIPSSITAPIATAKPTAPDKNTAAATEAPSATVSSPYQQLDQALNRQVAALSTIYNQRDRLKTKLREQMAAILPANIGSADGVIASSESLLNSSSPVASAAAASGLVGDSQTMVDIDGFLPLSVRFNPATYYQKYARVSGEYDSDYEAFTLEGAQTEALVSLARYAQLRKIPLVFVNLPLTQEYLDPARKQHEEAFQQKMMQLAPQTTFLYRDLSRAWTTQPEYFSDPSHLNRYGAYEVSRRLAQDVMIPWQLAR